MPAADVIVVGLGAMGSAATYHLARRGLRVVGIDRFAPPHTQGSSHGESRIIREAYFEHPAYVPLVRQAYEEWAQLESKSDRRLFLQTGALMIGLPDSAVVRGSLESARLHSIAHEVLSARAMTERFPELRPDAEMVAVLEQRAGVLFPEACVQAHLEGAASLGARLELGTTVTGWDGAPGEIRVSTDRGGFSAGRLILAAGPWMERLARQPLGLEVERQVVHWVAPGSRGSSPVTLWEHEPDNAFYTIPDLGGGLKVALHHGGEITTAEEASRPVAPAEAAAVEALLHRFLPGVAGNVVRSSTCLYTNTRDGHFLIDHHPADERVLLVSACSGHGFKFASAIGAAAADLATGVERPDLDFFTLRARVA